MSITGDIKFLPAGDGPLPEPEKAEEKADGKCASKCSEGGASSDIKMTISKVDDCENEKKA